MGCDCFLVMIMGLGFCLFYRRLFCPEIFLGYFKILWHDIMRNLSEFFSELPTYVHLFDCTIKARNDQQSQAVKNFFFKLSKISFSNCQKFPFQTVKNFLFKLSKISFFSIWSFWFWFINPQSQSAQ